VRLVVAFAVVCVACLASPEAFAGPCGYGGYRGSARPSRAAYRYYGYSRYSYRAYGPRDYARWRPYGRSYGRRYGSGYGYWPNTRSYRGYGYGASCGHRFYPGRGGYYRPHIGYFVRPYAALAPIYSRYGASLTLADDLLEREPGASGENGGADGDGLPQQRSERVGERFLVELTAP